MPSSATDCNLLFGILALQMDFISRDALIQGMNAWVLEKSKPLGQVLVEQGALASDLRACVEAMIDKHLMVHGNDPQQSLAAVSSAASIRQELEQIADPDLLASVAHLAQAASDDDPDRTPAAAGTPTSAGTRFRILRPHARGGLGEVFVANDVELHREVALKEIQARHSDDPARRARFLREAEITGGLEHPGIVPVYGLGQQPDGRPFYVMRFIRGDSLKEAITRFHQAVAEPRTSGERSVAFRELLGRFIDVCNAIAYAHSRRVLHRDLKPGNIMLGKYGETLVVDWGLAKAGVNNPGNGAAAESSEATLRPASASGSAETVAGTAIGTPAYMSPEQAGGRLHRIGPASDIYGLGATFYCVLTGRPPLQGEMAEVLKKVQDGDFPRPRQVALNIPPALEAICLKAMALRPQDRYSSPRELADDVEHWLADEPVRAWPESWTVKAGRWLRRHKPLVSGAAAAVFVGMVALTAGLLWYQDEQNRRVSEQAILQAETQRKQALADAAIRQALDQAEQRRAELHAILRKPGGVFGLLDDPPRWQAHIQAARGSLARAQAVLANAAADGDPELVKQTAQLHMLLERDEADRVFALDLEQIRIDRWTAFVHKQFHDVKAAEDYARTFAIAGLAVLEEPAPNVRPPSVPEKPAAVAAWLRASPIWEQLGAALFDWAHAAGTAVPNIPNAPRVIERLLEIGRLAAPNPGGNDRLWQLQLASWGHQEKLGQLVKEQLADQAPAAGLSAQVFLRVGMYLSWDHPLREPWLRRAQAQYPRDFWLNFALAEALAKANPVEAAGFWRVAVTLRPTGSIAWNNLGTALWDQQLRVEAIAAYRKATELDLKYASAYNNLGNALRAQQQLPDALAACRKAIELGPNYAWAHSSLGAVLADQKQLPEAIAAFRKALELDPRCANADYNLGIALYYQKRLPEAITALRKAIEVDPKHAAAYSNLGIALWDQKQQAEAIAAYRKAIEFDPRNAAAYNNLGNALREQKRLVEAVAALRKAIDLDASAAHTYANLGLALYEQKQLVEAIAAYRKAIELDPNDAAAHGNLGTAFLHHKQPHEAIAACRKAIALNPKLEHPYRDLGGALVLVGRFAEAAQTFQRGFDLLPENHPWRAVHAHFIMQSQQMQALARRVPLVLEGREPATPGEVLQMARMCRWFQQRPASAARLYQDAFKAKPELAEDAAEHDRYNAAVAAALAGIGQGEDAGILTAEAKAKLRTLARAWLRAELAGYAKQLKDAKPAALLQSEARLSQWQADAELAGVRSAEALAVLPTEEREPWNALWADVARLLNDARSRFTEARLEGALAGSEKSKAHQWRLVKGHTYAIDLESTAFDPFLKLEDPNGKLLAENDDIVPGVNLNSRLTFAAPADGVYRIVATAFEQAGTGPYTLRIREFKDAK